MFAYYSYAYASNSAQKDDISWPSSLFRFQNDDLRSMLESNKDSLKLEAMKRLISMIAKGKASSDKVARDLFPHVVKNVVTKNAELKKLVYLYLTRYAEQEQDLALLSISSFQRSLKDPNPLIRASALRVLSSIRVPMIAPIVLIAIKECSNDMSPYVRKTASHAILKLHHLDPDLKDEIIMIIERLLQDKTSLVLASAVAAFQEVCPDRFDLIHPNYRKFVSLLVDFDEWGQVILIDLLIRYAKTQFLDPNAKLTDSSEDIMTTLDPDHRLLLRNSKPLFQSRNSAVVMAVVQLYLEIAPYPEITSIIVKPLIRLLHSHNETRLIVLSCILTLTGPAPAFESNSTCRPSFKPLFEPFLKSFFVKSGDSTQLKILKLKILTNLCGSSNIPLILREFQAYINNYQGDMEFVSAIIKAIGRCASRVKEVAPLCLNSLISLLSSSNETIVAQSIIVVRTQIIKKDERRIEQDETKDLEKHEYDKDEEVDLNSKADLIVTMIIKQVIRLIDKIKTPNARATILWILAEFCNKNEKCYKVAPEVLRIVVKTFHSESSLVKLQAMNLASKIFLTIATDTKCIFNEQEKAKIKLLVNYIFNLAKYDINYDVRDRGRFLKQLIAKCDTKEGIEFAMRILMAPKMVPSHQPDKEIFIEYSSLFRIGTMSHFLDKKVAGYEELPDFPTVQPDPSVRLKPSTDDTTHGTTLEALQKDHFLKNSEMNKDFYRYRETLSLDSDDSDNSNDSDEDESTEYDDSVEEDEDEDDNEEDNEEDEEDVDEEDEKSRESNKDEKDGQKGAAAKRVSSDHHTSGSNK